MMTEAPANRITVGWYQETMEETIAAISTAVGTGGIGIVRISGGQAFSIGNRIFRRKNGDPNFSPKSHRLYLGNIVQPEDQEILDEALVVFMKQPTTYTREDMVEVQAHGGMVVLREILELVMREGARLAEPGEFTKRAYLNGRLDLSQAEAVIDVILAKTAKGLKIAEQHLGGGLKEEISDIRAALLEILATIEAEIDFSDEMTTQWNRDRFLLDLQGKIILPLRKIQDQFHAGQIFREGIKTVVVGTPNVGKSSLMNALLRKDRAIVTEIPGTTRDLLEEAINLDGIPFVIADSAGLQPTENPVEILGIRKTWDAIESSDMILFLIDADRGVESADLRIFERVKEKGPIIVLNKMDLIPLNDEVVLPEAMAGQETIEISAKTGRGLEGLEKIMVKTVLDDPKSNGEPGLVPNMRQKKLVDEALQWAEKAAIGIGQGIPEDIVAMDIGASFEKLGEILGIQASEAVLDEIFSRFCIGK